LSQLLGMARNPWKFKNCSGLKLQLKCPPLAAPRRGFLSSSEDLARQLAGQSIVCEMRHQNTTDQSSVFQVILTEKKMNSPLQSSNHLTGDLCSEENIAFLMLTEVLRARSLDILESLKNPQLNVTHLRRLALNMSLSAEDLIRSAGLLKRSATGTSINQSQRATASQEPASLHSILDLCLIAARNRLSEFNIELVSDTAPRDLFVGGNPWEIAYALFLLLRDTARAQAHSLHRAPAKQHPEAEGKIRLELEIAEGFVDICIPAVIALDPSYLDNTANPDSSNANHNMSHAEWFCFRRLLEANNALVNVQLTGGSPEQCYRITLRLPTFQPGHEEPIDFFTVSLNSVSP